MNIPYLNIESLITYELMQRAEEGIDVSPFHKRWEELKVAASDQFSDEKRLLFKEIAALPVPDRILIDEPSTLQEIREQCPHHRVQIPEFRLSPGKISDRIAGGWFGRAAGCLLGKPVEKIPRAGIR